jgi:hypothetical protein
VLDAGEECDDGNADNTDGCLTSCVAASCGDGFVWTGTEDCDGDPPQDCATGCGTTGTRGCIGCRWTAVCTPPAEVCNGLDEDCVDGPDNGFECPVGLDRPCATSCGSTGEQSCTSLCRWGVCAPPDEVCNGEDEDCVGGADNGFPCAMGAVQTCTTSCGGNPGTVTCSDACAWGACLPPLEVCNGADDDCDAACDDGFPCCSGLPTTCTTTCGSTGVGTCTADCARPTDAACTPPVERCNGADDDCDGGSDEDWACRAGATEECLTGTCPGTHTCSASCAWGACNLPVPANDTCAGATAITAGIDTSGTTCGAAGDYAGTCGGAGPDVVYRLDVAMRSAVTIQTGATWDTVLHLRGDGCPGSEVACNDNISGTDQRSRITTTVDAGTYYVVVDGRNETATGAFVLYTTVRPVNDDCSGAAALTLVDGRTTIAGSTAQATDSSDSCVMATAPDVWYSFRLVQREQVFVNTFGSAFDTMLAVKSTCAAFTGCEDDDCGLEQDQVVVTLDAGVHYVLIDGWMGASGAFTLNVEHLPVGSDRRARLLPAGSTSQTGDTGGAAGSAVDGSCGGGSAPEHLFYWTTCPADAGGAFTATTCALGNDFDTLLYLLSGPSGGELACNDNDADPACAAIGSRISASIPAGAGLFGFYVDGAPGASGDYNALVTRP